jgi:hypothetical protein
MSEHFVDDLAGSVRTAVAQAATNGLAAFGAAAALAVADMGKAAFVSDHATTGAQTLAQSLVTAFAGDLRGRIAADVDANGLGVGDAHCKTHLVAFASGEARAPVEDVSVEHAFAFALGAVAALEVAAKLTLKAACGFDENGKLKTSTTTKIKLEFAWSSEPAAKPAGI